jgi:TatD DNase family protein
MSMATFYDTHAHLNYPDFAPDFSDMLARAEAAGVTKLVAVGIDLESSKRCVQLAEQHPQIFAAIGWHPNHANEAPEDLRPTLRELARHPKVVAIGETGMDFYRLQPRDASGVERDVEADKRNQARLFEQHLEVAAELGLNAVVHQRAALEETLAIMGRFEGRVRGQFHCFADDTAAMQRVLALGSIVSFTGLLTYRNSQAVREALAAAPLDSFMFETDCPYLVPEPHRANRVRRCEPAFVKETAELAAHIRGCTLEDLSAVTCATAEKFFRLPR